MKHEHPPKSVIDTGEDTAAEDAGQPKAERPVKAGRAVLLFGVTAVAVAATSRLLAEERRLLYVAVTRARTALLVTAVGAEDADERPSRFLGELAGEGALAHAIGTDEQEGVRKPPVPQVRPQQRDDPVMSADRVPGHAVPRS